MSEPVFLPADQVLAVHKQTYNFCFALFTKACKEKDQTTADETWQEMQRIQQIINTLTKKPSAEESF